MILISACLSGIPCRYDGKAKTDPYLRKLVKEGKAVPVCPEVLGGLRIPRTPAEIQNGKVIAEDGRDVTDFYEKGVLEAWKICQENQCDMAVLKEKSPACGVHRIHDGSFNGTTIPGQGKLTSFLKKNGIPCLSEYEYKEKSI